MQRVLRGSLWGINQPSEMSLLNRFELVYSDELSRPLCDIVVRFLVRRIKCEYHSIDLGIEDVTTHCIASMATNVNKFDKKLTMPPRAVVQHHMRHCSHGCAVVEHAVAAELLQPSGFPNPRIPQHQNSHFTYLGGCA